MDHDISRPDPTREQREQRSKRRAARSLSTEQDTVYGPRERGKRREIKDPSARDRRFPGLSKKVYFELFGIGTEEKKQIAMKAAEKHIRQRDEFDGKNDPIKLYKQKTLEEMEEKLESIGQSMLMFGELNKRSKKNMTDNNKRYVDCHDGPSLLEEGTNIRRWLNLLNNMRPDIVEMKGYKKQDSGGKWWFKNMPDCFTNAEQINRVRKMFQVVEHGLLAYERALNRTLSKIGQEKSFYGDCSDDAIDYLTAYFLVRGTQGGPDTWSKITLEQVDKIESRMDELVRKGEISEDNKINTQKALDQHL